MEQITVQQAQPLQASLYSRFVEYIDRSDKTTQTYLSNLKQFFAWLKYRGITQPRREDILAFRDWLQTEHEGIRLDPNSPAGWSRRGDLITCSPNTTAQYLRTVRQFFTWTSSEGYYPDIAANIHGPRIRHDIHRKDALTSAEVLTIEHSILDKGRERMSAAKDPEQAAEQALRLYCIFLLAVNAGLRCIELSRAKVRDLQKRGGQAYLLVWGKGHTEPDARKPLAPEVYEQLRDYLKVREAPAGPDMPLFTATGNRSRGRRLDPRTISTMIKQALREAGYDSDRLTAHSLRHTAGTAVQEITGNLYQTQLYMRHSNPATTEIYLHNRSDQEQGDIAAALYRYYHRGY